MSTGDWSFDNEVCEDFDNHVAASVPGYELIHDYVVKLSQFYTHDYCCVLDIGCSTGTLINRMIDANNGRSVNFFGVDKCHEMWEKAYSLVGRFSRVTIDQYDAIAWFEEYSVPLQFITCILTLQFMPYKDRKNLLRECCDRLEKGGAMIVVEKILQEEGYDQKIFDDIYQEMKYENGLDKDSLFDKTMSLRGKMRPLTSKEDEELFYESGFNKVIPFIQIGCFKGWILSV